MIDYLLPILLFALPVFAVVALTAGRGKELKGSCGGVGADGKCSRCGKPAAEIPARKSEPCP
ncbi:MAG: hypothetical protein KDB80_05170 [Planctomycetes bacterium]|nr:hypothetical protein [Planctomycetota bacterium]